MAFHTVAVSQNKLKKKKKRLSINLPQGLALHDHLWLLWSLGLPVWHKHIAELVHNQHIIEFREAAHIINIYPEWPDHKWKALSATVKLLLNLHPLRKKKKKKKAQQEAEWI